MSDLRIFSLLKPISDVKHPKPPLVQAMKERVKYGIELVSQYLRLVGG